MRDLCPFEPDLVGLSSVIGGEGGFAAGPVVAVAGDASSEDGLSNGKIMSGLVREGEGTPVDMFETGITSIIKDYRCPEYRTENNWVCMGGGHGNIVQPIKTAPEWTKDIVY